MPTSTSVKQLSQQAKFIFIGTVREKGAATLPEVPVTSSTLVVRVDRIIEAPQLLQGYSGQDITVQLGEGQRVNVGQQRLFFTNGWIYGTSIAVMAVGHVSLTEAMAQRVTNAVQAAPDQAFLARAARASLVVSGKVVEVREPQATPRGPITEHDPMWREAVVQVEDVAKGAMAASAGGQVVVRFPASLDARWRQAPKFEVNQEGVFMLGDVEAEMPPSALAAPGAPGEFAAVQPTDFFPKEQLERLRSKIK
jgi:hypothetical protein